MDQVFKPMSLWGISIQTTTPSSQRNRGSPAAVSCSENRAHVLDWLFPRAAVMFASHLPWFQTDRMPVLTDRATALESGHLCSAGHHFLLGHLGRLWPSLPWRNAGHSLLALNEWSDIRSHCFTGGVPAVDQKTCPAVLSGVSGTVLQVTSPEGGSLALEAWGAERWLFDAVGISDTA